MVMESSTNSTENAEMPLLTFNSLYVLLREEKKTIVLQKLPDRFYEALKKFFVDKKKEILKLKESGETEKISKEKRVLISSKKLAQELFNLRCKKIASSAIRNSAFKDEDFKDPNITDFEEKYFTEILDATNKMKEGIM